MNSLIWRFVAMKKILIFCVICSGALGWNVTNAFSWDFPLMISPIAMIFNLNNGDAELSALDICKNDSIDVLVPEYKTSISRNEKFAYVKGKSPEVWVWFFASPPDSPSLTIDALGINGNTWNLADKEMWFNGSGFTIGDTDSVNYYSMSSETSIPNSVGLHNIMWSWRVTAVGGIPREYKY
jgi:hypothetical protein